MGYYLMVKIVNDVYTCLVVNSKWYTKSTLHYSPKRIKVSLVPRPFLFFSLIMRNVVNNVESNILRIRCKKKLFLK